MPKQNITANLNNEQLSLDMLSPNDEYYQSIIGIPVFTSPYPCVLSGSFYETTVRGRICRRHQSLCLDNTFVYFGCPRAVNYRVCQG